MLTPQGCKVRRERLLGLMQQMGLEQAVLSRTKTIYYFSGAETDATWPQTLMVGADGRCTLITNLAPRQAFVDDVRTYTGYTLERAFGRESGHAEMVAIARELATAGPAGLEAEWMTAGLAAALEGRTHNLTPSLIQMRRRKDPDELDCMRAAIRITEAGYGAIKERLEPGMTEFQAYSTVETAMVEAAQTSVDLKGDFACGTRAIRGGGPPTDRLVARGDLYIFDLFPSFHGYMCDLCRTFCAGPASDEQQEVWAYVLAGHDIAQKLIRPGAKTSAVYREIRDYLHRHPMAEDSFTHHAGHGVGMDGWEQPWLNAGSDQVFVEGEVIACEPGLYSPALNGGIRLEHNYLVTVDGPVALDSFPMEL